MRSQKVAKRKTPSLFTGFAPKIVSECGCLRKGGREFEAVSGPLSVNLDDRENNSNNQDNEEGTDS